MKALRIQFAVLLVAVGLIVERGPARAEDGYEAWLRIAKSRNIRWTIT